MECRHLREFFNSWKFICYCFMICKLLVKGELSMEIRMQFNAVIHYFWDCYHKEFNAVFQNRKLVGMDHEFNCCDNSHVTVFSLFPLFPVRHCRTSTLFKSPRSPCLGALIPITDFSAMLIQTLISILSNGIYIHL